MAKRKIVRLEPSKAKLLRFTPTGKSVTMPQPQRDEVLELHRRILDNVDSSERPIIYAALSDAWWGRGDFEGFAMRDAMRDNERVQAVQAWARGDCERPLY